MRRSRLVIPLMTLLLLAVPAPSGAVPLLAESEPNDTSATADAIPGGQCYVVGSGAVSPAGDDDVWSFPGSAGARLWAYVDTGGPQNAGATSTDSRLELLGTDGATLIELDNDDGIGNGGDGSTESGAASAIAGAPLSATGTHFLRVTENGDDGIIDPYRLYVAVSTTTVPEAAEPNNTDAEAMPVTGCPEARSGAISTNVDEDCYSFSVAAGETLFIAGADTENLVISLRTSCADPIENRLMPGTIHAFPAPAGVAYGWNVTAAGTYYIRVRGDGGVQGPYRIMIAHGPVLTPGPPGPQPGADKCAGQSVDQVGTSGDDVLVGTSADEAFSSLGGNDKITGGGGDDTICAGSGKDKVLGEGGGDTVKGGGGKDTLRGGGGKDRLAGQGGNDNLRGQGGSDRLNGGPGKDRCAQGGGTGPESSCDR
jgi:Ca2+-binding RTX toxin-like protein